MILFIKASVDLSYHFNSRFIPRPFGGSQRIRLNFHNLPQLNSFFTACLLRIDHRIYTQINITNRLKTTIGKTSQFAFNTNYNALLKTIIAMNFSYLFKYIVIGNQSKFRVTRVLESHR